MKIAIIGGGAAGLFSAWMLEEYHDVTVFEKDHRLGGHAQTVVVELNGKTRHVDAGIHYFSNRLQPAFMRLLRHFGAPVVHYNPSSTFVDARDGWTVCMPPWGGGGRLAATANPRTLSTLVNLQRLITGSVSLVEEGGDFQISLRDFVKALGLSPAFIRDFVYPYLCSFWGVSVDTVQSYSARNALSYLVLVRPPVLRPLPICEMDGGMQAYIDRLTGQLHRAKLRCGVDITSLRRAGAGYEIHSADGVAFFDQVVVATNAEQANAIVSGLPGTDVLRRTLGRVEYFDTTIAIHGDTRFLPPNPAHWSIVNGSFDGTHCAITDRAHANRQVHLFRSWITHARIAPDPCYAEIAFRHPHPDPAYFQAQRELAILQGNEGLWFAGMYVDHYDNHEGALKSAMTITRALAPGSKRLAVLR